MLGAVKQNECACKEQHPGVRQQNIAKCLSLYGVNTSIMAMLGILKKKQFQFTANSAPKSIFVVVRVWRSTLVDCTFTSGHTERVIMLMRIGITIIGLPTIHSFY